MGAYFGTDGIRGVAGDLLTAEFAVQVGRAAAVVEAGRCGRPPLFIVGRDTRLSGPMLEAGLVAGLTSGGARVEVAGVIPTPGLAALVLERGADAGVVISASHNPFQDNGIKLFSSAGLKLSDGEEAEIEAHIVRDDLHTLAGDRFGSAERSRAPSRATSGTSSGGCRSTSRACRSLSTAPTAPCTGGAARARRHRRGGHRPLRGA